MEKYEKCKHQLIVSKIKYRGYENHQYKDHACIKCGLRDDVLGKKYDWLYEDEEIMYKYLRKNFRNFRKSQHTNIICDLDLACAIYKRVKEIHPKANDKLIIKYVEIALDNIRNTKVTDERKENRIKRLRLEPHFKSWDIDSIVD